MGLLADRVNDIKSIQARLDNQPQKSSMSTSAEEAVLSVTQSQQMLLNALARLQQQVESSNKAIQQVFDTRPILSELGKIKTSMGNISDSTQTGNTSSRKDVANLSGQVIALGLQIDALPTSFPLPKDIDLSSVSKDINGLKTVIAAIKIPEMPKTIDVRPQLKEMEARMGKRIFKFDVIRDTVSGLIDKIVVTEK